MKFKIRVRDWKGTYDNESVIGWKLFASENKITTGSDCFAEIYCKGTGKVSLSGQEVYDIYEALLCGESITGYDLDKKDDNILIKL